MPKDWATPDNIQAFAPIMKIQNPYEGARTICVDAANDLVLLGGTEGKAGVFSISGNKMTEEFSVGSPVTSALWAGGKAVVATSTGTIKVFENGTEMATLSGHAGEVSDMALHPSGEILASVGVDKSFIFYDLQTSTQALQVGTTSGKNKQNTFV